MNVAFQARAALEDFKLTGVFAPLPDDMEQNDYAVWQCVFEDHPGPWAEIALTMSRRLARRSLDAYNTLLEQESRDSYLHVTSMLAHGLVTHYSIHNIEAGTFRNEEAKRAWRKRFADLQPQVLEVWMDTFAHLPLFKKYMLEQTERHAMFFPDSATVIEKYLETYD